MDAWRGKTNQEGLGKTTCIETGSLSWISYRRDLNSYIGTINTGCIFQWLVCLNTYGQRDATRRLRSNASEFFLEKAYNYGDMEFSLYGREGDKMVEGVTTFKYLGHPLDQTDDDCPSIRQNIM